MHQYYEYRIGRDGRSVVDGLPYLHYTRKDFASHVPVSGHWYVCMQNLWKTVPKFDLVLSQILAKDPLVCAMTR